MTDNCTDPTHCTDCGDVVPTRRADLGYRTCLKCGEKQAVQARSSWCVLTPHKQGAMFFTASFAREAARGVNNKGGLVR